MSNINDFGKKIGGARKDLWKLRGLLRHDILDMNEGEKTKYVCKNNIWLKPDIPTLLDNGIPRFVIYWRNEIRKAIYPSPRNNISFEDYIEGVHSIEELANAVISENEIPDCIANIIALTMCKVSVYRYDYTDSYRGILNGNKILKMKSAYTLACLKAKMEKEDFGLSELEAISRKYTVVSISDTFSITEQCGKIALVQSVAGSRTFFYPAPDVILQKESYVLINSVSHRILLCSASEKNCRDMKNRLISESLAKSEGEKKQKKTWLPKQFSNLQKTGMDFRNGKNISGKDILENFGIRGGEFGNWTNDKERQASLNMVYDAFADLANALGIAYKDVTLPGLQNGGLGIAIGARGRGNAAAHYEPELEVINLTKNRGAGSLSHEWGHALDDMIAKTYLSSESSMASEVYSRNRSTLPSGFCDVMDRIYKNSDSSYTDYYIQSEKFDSSYKKHGNGYWASPCELFARAFACYVLDRIQGIDDFLNGHAESYVDFDEKGNKIYAYPRGKEREAINGSFDELFCQLKENGVFNPLEASLPKITSETPYREDFPKQLSFF